MFPIGDDNSGRHATPVVTIALIAICAFVFFLQLQGGDEFTQTWAFTPARFTADPIGAAPTLITAMFMHGGWAHFAGNMLYLWIFGDNVEDRLGKIPFLIFYLVCGIAASFAQYAVSPGMNIPNLGASGAIAGVLGAYILMFPKALVRVAIGYSVVALPAIVQRRRFDRDDVVGRGNGRRRLYGARRWLCCRTGADVPVRWAQHRAAIDRGVVKERDDRYTARNDESVAGRTRPAGQACLDWA